MCWVGEQRQTCLVYLLEGGSEKGLPASDSMLNGGDISNLRSTLLESVDRQGALEKQGLATGSQRWQDVGSAPSLLPDS